MPHCKVCGNPVSREETECRICGSKLNEPKRSTKKAQGGFKQSPSSGTAPYGNQSTNTWSPPVNAQDERPKGGISKMLLASILVLIIVAVAIGFVLYSMEGVSPTEWNPIIPNGKSLAFDHYDNTTIQVNFNGFDSSMHFSDCAFRISIDTWTSSPHGMVTWQSVYVTSDVSSYTIDVYFVDWDDNGYIDSQDYCILSTENVPIGLHCSMGILNAHSNQVICEGTFTF